MSSCSSRPATQRGRPRAAIDDRLHNEVHGDNVAVFGFFEAEDAATRGRPAAARGGVGAAPRPRLLRGPLNPSLNESAGLLVDGFDTDPMLMMPHNPPEYAGYIESAGYRKVKDLYAWLYDLGRDLEPAIVKLARAPPGEASIVVRPLELSEFEREIERLREIYCGAWAHNWGFVPPTAGGIPPARDASSARSSIRDAPCAPRSTAGRSRAPSPFPISTRR